MPWTPKCPKCGSGAISVRPMSGGGYRTADEDVFLSCVTCGKRVYGKSNIEAMLDEQKRAWEKDPEAQAAEREAERQEAEEEARRRRQAQADAAHRRYLAEQARKKREAEDLKRQQEMEAWQARVRAARAQEEAQAPTPKVLEPHPEECAWEPCHNPRRENSKYCSTSCKNHYARSRYKARKEAQAAAK